VPPSAVYYKPDLHVNIAGMYAEGRSAWSLQRNVVSYFGADEALVGVAFINAVLFSAFGWFRERTFIKKDSIADVCIAGAGAGALLKLIKVTVSHLGQYD
jgi:hypothetical protein